MDLRRDQWFVRWFFWSLRVQDKFLERRRSFDYAEQTNLCHFIRVIFLWAPLIIVLHLVAYGALVFSLLGLPIHLFGVSNFALIALAVVVFIGLIFLAFIVVGWVCDRVFYPKPESRHIFSKNTTHVGFLSMLWTWLVAMKQRVCPIINFTPEKE